MNSPLPSELDLILATRQGDLAAFGLLVRQHEGRIRAFLAVRLPASHEAEDLAQETFLVAYRRLQDFDESKPLGAWLHGIALRLLQNHLRKRKPEAIGHVAELNALVAEELERQQADGREEDRFAAVRLCLGELDEESSGLMKARYEEDLPLQVLCSRFGKKHSAMTMWLHRIRLALRSCVERKLASA